MTEQRLADSFARAYARAPAGFRARALRGPQRRLVLGRIFHTMERSFDRERGGGLDAVIHWEIAGERARVDRWQVVLEGGRCAAGRALDREPTIVIKAEDAAFLDLVSGAVAAPALYMSGRLRIEGDPMLAARFQSLFRVPKPNPGK